MVSISCKKSLKSGKTYLVLVVNGVYVSFDTMTIQKVALTNGVSNVDLSLLKEGENIIIKEV